MADPAARSCSHSYRHPTVTAAWGKVVRARQPSASDQRPLGGVRRHTARAASHSGFSPLARAMHLQATLSSARRPWAHEL
jgi:hypothetical protein